MNAGQSALVHDALALSKSIRDDIALSVPAWPMGLPDWYADSLTLTLKAPGRTFVYVWHRGGDDAELTLHFGPGVRARHLVEQYPAPSQPGTRQTGQTTPSSSSRPGRHDRACLRNHPGLSPPAGALAEMNCRIHVAVSG